MRVLYVEAAYGFGGSLTGLLHLFSELPADVEPVLITSFDPHPYIDMPPDLIHRQVALPEQRERPGHWLPGLLHYYRHTVRPWQVLVDQLVEEFQPDVIHANNMATFNLGAALVGKKRKIPTVSHQKDFEYPGKLTKWIVGRNWYDHHIAMSEAIAQQLFDLGLDRNRCTTIFDPVLGPSPQQLTQSPRTPSHPNEVPVVAMHSMLLHWKGQHVFLRALAEVRQRCRQPFQAVIAGTSPAGETDYAESLHRLVDELGLQDLVTFCGHVRDVYDFLATVDISVHASIDPEAFGRVVPEAMLSGLPTIVTLGGGPPEYVAHGKCGLHVPRNDVAAMSDAIEQLVTDAQLRRMMGQAARNFALQEFDPAALSGKIVAVYRRLLSDSPSV